MSNNESVSIPITILKKIKNDKSSLRSSVVAALERYVAIRSVGIREVRRTFTDNELLMLADICNGTMFEPFQMVLENNAVLIQVEDAEGFYNDHYFQKHGVSGDELKTKLENLSKPGQIALIEVIEQFWSNEKASMAQTLQALR